MAATKKKALALMQKGVITYKLLSLGWDVSDHLGDGYDLLGEKDGNIVKIELKAIDLNTVQPGKNATQHVTANQIVSASHLIITLFEDIVPQASYVMNIRQLIETAGVEKNDKYGTYKKFFSTYIELAKKKSGWRSKYKSEKVRLDFDINFNPRKQEKWKLAIFKDQWLNLDTPS